MRYSKKQGIGYLTYALNTDIDYEKCAVLWALSLRATQKNKIKIAVIVNDTQTCRKDLHSVCDYVISKPKKKVINEMHYEADLLTLTPFKETIKMECDMLVPCDMNVWLHTFRLQDLTITGHVINHKNKKVNDYRYRQFIKVNNLPNVYNGLYYVRLTEQNVKFYRELDKVFTTWDQQIRKFRMWDRHEASTDFAMSIALNNLSMEHCVMNTFLPTFVHNKRYCVGDWQYYSIPDPSNIIIDGVKIDYPWHYHTKSMATENLISKYKQHV
jgi:hypothetical protein|tara:strand:+ start:25148 stop:25957 length:810 start_codon:yes stop_codon:yes gene_type:complete